MFLVYGVVPIFMFSHLSFSVSGMMNHINYVLATTISQLSLVKNDNLRFVSLIALL